MNPLMLSTQFKSSNYMCGYKQTKRQHEKQCAKQELKAKRKAFRDSVDSNNESQRFQAIGFRGLK